MKTGLFVTIAAVFCLSTMGCWNPWIPPTDPVPGEVSYDVAAARESSSNCIAYLGKVSTSGKTYYAYMQTNGKKSEVWLRVKKDSCSNGDIKYMGLTVSKSTLKDVARSICRAKSYYNKGRTVVGCLSTAGTVICGAATASSGGAAASVCTGVIYYTGSTGLQDCVQGISELIASAFGRQKEVKAIITQTKISSGQFVSAIDDIIDLACDDI
jgi:hypothetical protein